MAWAPSQLPSERVLAECRAIVWSLDRGQWFAVGGRDIYSQIELIRSEPPGGQVIYKVLATLECTGMVRNIIYKDLSSPRKCHSLLAKVFHYEAITVEPLSMDTSLI